jgi:hypothetical protein
MTQGILPFKYENDQQNNKLTGFGGLLSYLDLAQAAGLSKSINQNLSVSSDSQGWTDSQVVMSLMLLNLVGGDCVEDMNCLESDEGLCKVIERTEKHGMNRKERRSFMRRWRKDRKRTFPSPSAVFRYLSGFHDRDQEELREKGKAFIPEPNEDLKGLVKVNKDLMSFVQKGNRKRTATLDMDATLVETNKAEALYCYKGFKSYQPLNTWWAEQGLVLHTEFRDGNVPAGYEQLRVFKEALRCLPEGVKEVRLRSDTAGYQHKLLRYCDRGKNKRFGKIEFAIGCDVTREFKKAVSEVPESEWKPLSKKVKGEEISTGREWAEVCFVPNAIGHSKNGPEYRYLATREAIAEQLIIPGTIEGKEESFESMSMESKKYKVFGIVTNMDWDGQELITWLYKRCGKSEEAHSIMKEDLAGGKLPTDDFGANAAWWWIMILALNLNNAMKMLVLGKGWISRRMKAIRLHLITLPARVMERSRELSVRLQKDHPSIDWLLNIRAKILLLSSGSPG